MTYLKALPFIMVFVFFSGNNASSQVISKPQYESDIELTTIDFKEDVKKGYFHQYLNYTWAFAGLSTLTLGMLYIGNTTFAHLIVGAGALATIYLPGVLMYRTANRYGVYKNKKAAILCSFLGAASGLSGALLIYKFNGGFLDFPFLATLYGIPGIVSVLTYSFFPAMQTGIKTSLINLENGTLQPGLPTLSVTPGNIMEKQAFYQVSLARITF